MPAPRLLIGLGVVVAAVVLFVVLRPGNDEPTPAADTQPAATAPTETAETGPAQTEEEPEPDIETEEEPPAAEPEPQSLAIVVRGGLPEGGIQRLAIRQGEEVRIVVRSDTVDEVHLHGYELVRRVGPGAPAQFRFTATVPGRFEIETHERHVLVGELEVRP